VRLREVSGAGSRDVGVDVEVRVGSHLPATVCAGESRS